MKIHGGETRCPRARIWRAEPRLMSCWTRRQTDRPPGGAWCRTGKQSKIRERNKVQLRSQISLCSNFTVPALSNVCKKVTLRALLRTISLLRECQTSMNLTPLAKITCLNDNIQRHAHTPPTTKLCPKNIQSHSSNWSEKLITAAFQMDGKFNVWF